MNEDTCLYVIAIKDGPEIKGPCKVGISRQPQTRLAAFQTACPYELTLVKVFLLPSRQVALDMERCFHETQKRLHIRGEWFEMPPSDAVGIVTLHIRWAVQMFTDLEGDDLQTAFEMAGVT